MATQPLSLVDYPTRDGRPVGETPKHRDVLWELIDLLRRRFADDPMAYVSGNMMMYYVEGDKRRHVSPDVFVTTGIPDDGRLRDAYFVWVEGKGPDFVVELTSKSTRREDERSKLALYRDVLKVREYFLFDPYGEYLKPQLKGYRLVGESYEPIAPVAGRLPSEVTGLRLEIIDGELRLHDPTTGRPMIPYHELPRIFEQDIRELGTALEEAEAIARDNVAIARQSQEARERAEAEARASREARERAEAEAERLRRLVDELRRRLAGEGS